MSRVAIIAASLVLAVGCAEEAVPPTPPDLSALIEQYRNPSGEVTAESVATLLESTSTELALVTESEAILGLFTGIFGGLEDAAEEDAQGLSVSRQALTIGTTEVNADGWIIYHRICPTANGSGVRGRLRMTMLGTLESIQPIIWGRATDCRIDGSNIDGDIALFVDFVDGEIVGLLARIDGRLKVGDVVNDGVVSFSWADGVVEVLKRIPAGEFVLGFDTADNAPVVRGANGAFICDGSRCSGPDGEFDL